MVAIAASAPLPLPSAAPSSFSAASFASSALTRKGSTLLSPTPSMSSSRDLPQTNVLASTSTPAASAPKPVLAVKPVAPAPAAAAVRPAPVASSVVSLAPATAGSPGGPQSPASALSPAASSSCGIPGKPPMSITSKEWVIPPRPKPGRKPATDTPPTKRKAQNRAAQRAFRERRAARVGELEEQLDEQKAEHDRIEQEYCDKIRALEMDLQVLHSRCQMLESLLEKEKTANQAWASTNTATDQRRHQDHQQQQQQQQLNARSPETTSPGAVSSRDLPKTLRPDQLPRGSASSSVSSASGRWPTAQPFSISQIISPPDEDEDLTCGSCDPNGPCLCAEDTMNVVAAMDCSKCNNLGSKCACLEESLQALNSAGGDAVLGQDRKRAHSSTPPPMRQRTGSDEKKARFDTTADTEIDFTNMFSLRATAAAATINPTAIPTNGTSNRTRLPAMPTRQASPPPPLPRFEIPMKDKCGFCSDGTYCVCADSMPGVTMTGSLALSAGTVVAQQKTPPPSENDSNGFGTRHSFGGNGGNAMLMPLEVTPTGAITLSSLSALRRQREAAAAAAASSPSSLEMATASLPSIRESLCGPGGPGTCAQCLADPISGLFCRSLAANFARQAGSDRSKAGGGEGGCCGGGGGGGGCCKDKAGGGNSNSAAPSTLEPKIQQQGSRGATSGARSGESLRLSCADAYKTLASHRHFDEATDEIGTWLPKLRAAPRQDDGEAAWQTRATKAPDRVRHHPLEVEAASIMSVLKGFDVRFGKSA